LLTLRGSSEPRRGAAMRELGVIPDGAVLIQDGVILSLGPSRRVENLSLARNAVEIDATGRVVARPDSWTATRIWSADRPA